VRGCGSNGQFWSSIRLASRAIAEAAVREGGLCAVVAGGFNRPIFINRAILIDRPILINRLILINRRSRSTARS
jgi:hypothetical protein